MKNSYAKEASLLTLSQVLTTGTSLIVVMLLSRFRTLEEYGTYSQIMLVVTLAVSIVQLGIPNSINYFIAKSKNLEEKIRFYNVYYTISTFVGMMTGVILTLLLPVWIDFFKNEGLKMYWWMLLILPLTNCISNSVSYLLISAEKTYNLVWYNIWTNMMQLVIIIIIKVQSGTFRAYLTLYVLLHVIMMLYIYHLVWRISNKKICFCLSRELVRSIYHYSIPLGISTILGTINIEIDKLMVGGLLGTEILAIYTNTGKELPIAILTSSITAVLTPKIITLINKGEIQDAIKLWKSSAIIGFGIMAFFASAFIVFAPQIVVLLYGKKYISGVLIFQIYSCVLLVRFTYFGMILSALNKTKLIMYANCVCILVNCTLNFIFYKIMGLTGPALATVVSTVLIALLQIILTAKEINIKVKILFPWRDFFELIIINAILGIVFHYIVKVFNMNTSAHDILLCIVLGGIWMLIYLSLIGKKMISIYKISVGD